MISMDVKAQIAVCEGILEDLKHARAMIKAHHLPGARFKDYIISSIYQCEEVIRRLKISGRR